MKNKIYILFIFLFAISNIFAQQFIVSGTVKEKNLLQPLSFTNIRVAGTTLGTSSNVNGEYEIKLYAGEYKLIASFIGFNSDTINIRVNKNLNSVDFQLEQTKIDLPEVIVSPGINPALEIIRKAIEKKRERNQKLNSYEVEALTKGLIRTTDDLVANDNSIGVGLGGNDSTELRISGILENHSKNFYQKPGQFKSIILARKQSANFPPSINILTGGRLIQSFYENDVNFLGRDLPGPIADKALNYYYYFIEKVTAQNNKKVYQIHIEPDNPSDPGFMGNIFIADSSYNLIKVDLILNRAANTGGIFDTVNIYQQFDDYSGIYLPIDYRLFVKANLLGLVKVGFELNTILFNYNVNQPIPENIFNKAIVTVVPEADQKDSTYWNSTPSIPNTDEEQSAYKRIDSLESIPRHFLDDYSILDNRININNNISVSAPLGMYHFSRVEGHALDFGVFVKDALNRRLNSSLKLSYGFSDKKYKPDFSAYYLLGNYRTWKLSFNAFKRLNVLFGESDNYNEFLSTLITLTSKNEFRDYYYTKGFSLGIEGELFPILKVRAGFNNNTDNSAFNNSDFSFFNKSKNYRVNPPIYETRLNTLNFGFDIDFRDYIEDGYYRRRTSLGRSYILFSGNITYSDKSLLNSKLNFTTYELNTNIFLRTFRSATLRLNLFGRITDGYTPYQNLFAIPGNIDILFNPNTFRTLTINEIMGDKLFTLNFTHDFRDEIFRFLNIPGLKNSEILFTLIFNAAISDISPQTKQILINSVKIFKHPFYEIGFGIGQGIIPFKIEFMWKLNYLNENNFRVGLNMPIL